MIWLITLFLLFVTFHLIKQGLEEKRVLEKIATDSPESNDRDIDMDMTIAEEDGIIGNAVASVQNSNSLFDNKIEQRIQKAANEDESGTLFGRSVDKVKGKLAGSGEKLEAKIKRSAESDDSESFFNKSVNAVTERTQKLGDKVAEQTEKRRNADEGSSFFGKAVSSVQTRLEDFDEKMGEKFADKAEASKDKSGLFDRAMASVSNVDEKIESRLTKKMEKNDDDSLFSRTVAKVSDKVAKS